MHRQNPPSQDSSSEALSSTRESLLQPSDKSGHALTLTPPSSSPHIALQAASRSLHARSSALLHQQPSFLTITLDAAYARSVSSSFTSSPLVLSCSTKDFEQQPGHSFTYAPEGALYLPLPAFFTTLDFAVGFVQTALDVRRSLRVRGGVIEDPDQLPVVNELEAVPEGAPPVMAADLLFASATAVQNNRYKYAHLVGPEPPYNTCTPEVFWHFVDGAQTDEVTLCQGVGQSFSISFEDVNGDGKRNAFGNQVFVSESICYVTVQDFFLTALIQVLSQRAAPPPHWASVTADHLRAVCSSAQSPLVLSREQRAFIAQRLPRIAFYKESDNSFVFSVFRFPVSIDHPVVDWIPDELVPQSHQVIKVDLTADVTPERRSCSFPSRYDVYLESRAASADAEGIGHGLFPGLTVDAEKKADDKARGSFLSERKRSLLTREFHVYHWDGVQPGEPAREERVHRNFHFDHRMYYHTYHHGDWASIPEHRQPRVHDEIIERVATPSEPDPDSHDEDGRSWNEEEWDAWWDDYRRWMRESQRRNRQRQREAERRELEVSFAEQVYDAVNNLLDSLDLRRYLTPLRFRTWGRLREWYIEQTIQVYLPHPADCTRGIVIIDFLCEWRSIGFINGEEQFWLVPRVPEWLQRFNRPGEGRRLFVFGSEEERATLQLMLPHVEVLDLQRLTPTPLWRTASRPGYRNDPAGLKDHFFNLTPSPGAQSGELAKDVMHRMVGCWMPPIGLNSSVPSIDRESRTQYLHCRVAPQAASRWPLQLLLDTKGLCDLALKEDMFSQRGIEGDVSRNVLCPFRPWPRSNDAGVARERGLSEAFARERRFLTGTTEDYPTDFLLAGLPAQRQLLISREDRVEYSLGDAVSTFMLGRSLLGFSMLDMSLGFSMLLTRNLATDAFTSPLTISHFQELGGRVVVCHLLLDICAVEIWLADTFRWGCCSEATLLRLRRFLESLAPITMGLLHALYVHIGAALDTFVSDNTGLIGFIPNVCSDWPPLPAAVLHELSLSPLNNVPFYSHTSVVFTAAAAAAGVGHVDRIEWELSGAFRNHALRLPLLSSDVVSSSLAGSRGQGDKRRKLRRLALLRRVFLSLSRFMNELRRLRRLQNYMAIVLQRATLRRLGRRGYIWIPLPFVDERRIFFLGAFSTAPPFVPAIESGPSLLYLHQDPMVRHEVCYALITKNINMLFHSGHGFCIFCHGCSKMRLLREAGLHESGLYVPEAEAVVAFDSLTWIPDWRMSAHLEIQTNDCYTACCSACQVEKVRLSFYDGALVGRCGAHTARSATHPRTAPQADDMCIGQLFGLVNHC
ncbi:hypothetical protein OAO87_00040, partial [bacterium]|nr:hypothetical protein [bacterium]